MFTAALFIVSVLSGATASVVGFGIGSLLTPFIALLVDMNAAVAAVTIPHACATALRCWRLRAHVDRQVLAGFGLLSALGALAGALLYTTLGPSILTRVLGALLVVTSISQLAGVSLRWSWNPALSGVFGFLSGFFGGLAGNQGGLRSAALTTFSLSPKAFVATATATGLLVDAVRTPVYLWTASDKIAALLPWIEVATVGVLLGTLIGERILLGLTKVTFARLVATGVGVLGISLILAA